MSYVNPFREKQPRNPSIQLHKEKCYNKALYGKVVLDDSLASVGFLRNPLNGDLVVFRPANINDGHFFCGSLALKSTYSQCASLDASDRNSS